MSRKQKRNEKNNKLKIFIIVAILIILIVASILAYMILFKDKNKNEIISQETEEGNSQDVQIDEEETPKEETGVKIYSGTQRPIAVMIDNHKGAWPQAGLQKAYAIYEIIVEGGETRLMAIFKGQDVEKIGPVRSSRHYFLDYALENDAIYTHYGWSPKAESDIKSLGVNNINGITESSSSFWRIKQKSSPHNVLTSIAKLKEIAKNKKYKMTSSKKSVLNYVTSQVELESGKVANKVRIPYSTLHTTSYEYNPETKIYTRYARGKKQTDFETGKAITTKNIIITFVKNTPLNDGENKDRQNLSNTGTFKGYYITNGKAIEIKCIKESRKAQTVYKDLNGKEINVNDGNTIFNICPIDAKVTFE